MTNDNNSALLLAADLSDSEDDFARWMNRLAAELKMPYSFSVNAM